MTQRSHPSGPISPGEHAIYIQGQLAGPRSEAIGMGGAGEGPIPWTSGRTGLRSGRTVSGRRAG